MSDSSGGARPLDAEAILAVLNDHRVDYVVIGAWAAIAQGAPIGATRDIDLTPAIVDGNLDRLSAALKELGARIRAEGAPAEGLAFDHDGPSLARAAFWNLVCRHGELDLSFTPSGTGGYRDLAANARVVRVHGVEARIADLADIIRSKEAAGRPKDIQLLPVLYQHLRARGG